MRVRRALTAVAITSGLVLGVAACGGDGGGNEDKPSSESSPAKSNDSDKAKDKPQAPAEEKVLAETTAGKGMKITITSAVREEGGFLTVSGKVTNGGSDRYVPIAWNGDEKELQGNGASMAGATLVDEGGKKRYFILRDTEGGCLCTQFKGGFDPGEERPFFAQFPSPPDSATSVAFQIADAPPATIEISEGE
ncbi:hypothetical protein H9Y04_34405 [Streptomyces sp. TRM66268-LWL]|uniref:Secreted protein n=1 Tax=Streptomyces polyasparticus TaxID=2767826 RepID=A0ABR7SQ57_9ACTN|nr:hypothetical protein [Streptomyces polyasparticus]MBC9717636.1 hypothetical protein [Streptomyces polyasparticus]